MLSTTSAILSSLRNHASEVNWQKLLEDIISSFDCSTGTLHFYDKESNLLKLQAQQGIPAFLLPKMTEIPIGKGMAGIAAERRQPVEMCNLQTDNSGVARPAAKETKVEGSIAVPMLLEGNLYGVFGVAKPVPYDFTQDEQDALIRIGQEMSRYIRAQASPVG
ncbi:GAF domain-containing protein [Pontibacter flavimaris]|uniref:Histidine kinase n=1 Tax=Pontibacter flavimaris TaxID=1797110 RepID=A0A1Q5PDL2_9BACT|nr:GAF domain-containing protein [Pontibacter flavimaris]OKL40242.1 histidine kinase [Pontibacter flavimaris]